MTGRENTETNLYPEHAEHLGEGQWVVVKVEAWLDQSSDGGWREVLKGASIKLGAQPHIKLKSEVGGKKLGVTIDDRNERLRLFPLMPAKGGTNRLLVAGRPRFVLKLTEDGLGLPIEDGEGEVLKLKPLPKNLGGCLSPLVFYKLQPVYPRFESVLNTWKFKCYDTSRAKIGSKVERRLEGRVTNCDIKLLGRQHHPPRKIEEEPLRELCHIYLLGIQPKGSQKLLLVEADLFNVDKDPGWGHEWAVREDLEDTEMADFREERKGAVHGFGTDKKAKIMDKAHMKILDENKVADKENALAELAGRRLDQKGRGSDTTLYLDELNNRKKVLPPFDLHAQTAEGIYASKLVEHLAPERLVLEEDVLLDEDLVTLLSSDPKGIKVMKENDLLRICKSSTVAAILLQRAETGIRESRPDAKSMSRKLGVLNVLIRMHEIAKKKHQVLHLGGLCEEMGMEKHSRLMKHVHGLFTTFASSKSCPVDMYKLVCHIFVWALHLTPDFSLDVLRIYKELGYDHEYAKTLLGYCGCKVKAEMSGRSAEVQGVERCVATLTAPMSFDFDHGGARKKRKKD